jgi:hypothetical protein
MQVPESRKACRPGRWSGLVSMMFLSGLVLLLLAGGPSASAQTQGSNPSAITQSFDFAPPLFGSTGVNGKNFSTVAMPGAMLIAQNPGEPALPVKFVQIALPPGMEVSRVTVTGVTQKLVIEEDLTANPLFPYQAPLPIGTERPGEFTINEAIYGSDAFFPAVSHFGERVGVCRGYGIYSVGLYPVKYAPMSGELHWSPHMTLTLELKESSGVSPFFRNNREDETWVKSLVCNPAMTDAYDKISPKRAGYPGGICNAIDDYDYVIITTTTNGLDAWSPSPTTPHNWDSLMGKHLATSGLACTVVTIQDIMAEAAYENLNPLFNDQPARMREFCKDAYQDWGISYVLIGADAEWIVSRLMSSSAESNVDADIYFNHLDNTFNDDQDNQWGEEGDNGFDLYAEFFIGRITADEPKDVSNWLEKCFYYIDSSDRSYLDNAAFYGGDTGWPCQGDDFIDYSAIYGLDHWLGPNPGADPYPSWLGFQYGFDTWNQQNVGAEYDMSVMWTAEPPNPGGWVGGSESAAIAGLKNSISNDEVTLLSGIAHANYNMSLDVQYTSWESDYHNTRPFFIHDYGCHCGDMDAGDDGVLHSMLFHSDTELAFACVYNTGYGWGNFDCTCSSSALQQKSFWDYYFDVTNNSGSTANWQLGKGMAYARDLMAPTIDTGGSWREIIQCCLLFGDPALTIKPPAVPPLYLSFPDGVPEGHQNPGLANTISVKIAPSLENYVPGTGFMYYRFDPGNSFTAQPLTPLGGEFYEATLPNTRPGDEPEFYFVAEGDGGSTITAPWNAPTETYAFEVYVIESFFYDGFETGGFGPWWTTSTSGAGRILITTDHGPRGTYHVTMDSSSDGTYGTASMTLAVYLQGATGADLTFYFKEFNDEVDPEDNVSIRQAGSPWYNVMNLADSSTYTQKYIDLDQVTTQHGINIKDPFEIRWQWRDNYSISTDGFAFDDISIDRQITSSSVWSEAYSFQGPVGCTIPIHLDADSAFGGRNYILGLGLSGSAPGTTLPGGLVLPINWDWLTALVVNNPGFPPFQNFHGSLDSQGEATAVLNIPGPGAMPYVGSTLTVAFAVTAPYDFVSNAISISIEP